MTSSFIKADRQHHGSLVRRLAPHRLALAGFLVAGACVPASAIEFGPLVQITGPSPLAGCSPAGQTGTNYPETEIEPWVDANLRNPRNLIAAWQQDRWSNGGARGNVTAHSFDGGATWKTVKIPKVTDCTGGPFKRASDPWVTIAPNGVAFVMSLAFNPDLPSGQFGRNAMLVNRSTNGGQTWSNPIFLVDEPPGQTLHDKNSMTADYTNADLAYAVWDRLRDFTLPPGAGRAAAVKAKAGTGDGVVAARERLQQLRARARSGIAQRDAPIFFEGPAVFTRTTDGGDTWEPVKVIFDPGGNAQTINNLVVVRPNGAIYDFFTHIFPNGGLRIGFVRSNNKGVTFTGPRYPTTIATVNGVVTPDELILVRDASILFDTAVDRKNGNLYLAWQDVRFTGFDAVAFSMSKDGGLSWSMPIKVNRTPANDDNPLREQVFVPSIEVGPHGGLVVTYYDFRFDDEEAELADHFALFCRNNCTHPGNWRGEKRLTQESFDMLDAPFANGLFLGDYVGLVASKSAIHPVFGITDGPNQTSDFTRRAGNNRGHGFATASAD
jgi:hypothetical protein